MEASAIDALPEGAQINLDAAGEFDVLDIAVLRTDPAYQRELSMEKVNEFARAWSYKAAGSAIVGRRANGDLFIVDGQHRCAAAATAGKTHIVAQVIESSGPEYEAGIRLLANTRRADTPSERFRAQLAAGNPESLAIQAICEQFGTRINRSPDTRTGINSVSAVERIYRVDEGVLLTRTLEFIQDAFGTVGGKVTVVGILQGVAWLLQKHTGTGEMVRDRMIERVAATGPDNLHARAVNYRAVHGGAMWTNYYRAMVEVYNDKLTDKAKLPWRLGGRGSVKTGAGSGWG